MAENLQITKASSNDGEMLDSYGREHSEKYGPLGYTFLVGRRHPA